MARRPYVIADDPYAHARCCCLHFAGYHADETGRCEVCTDCETFRPVIEPDGKCKHCGSGHHLSRDCVDDAPDAA